MKSNYKPIGDYIKRVESRNSDLKVTKLLGLSMSKEFRETTSNIVGTDMSVYRVMSKYQFACDFMSPIRVNKLPVVLKLDDEPNLVSPAYPVFEISDKNKLEPEYLMLWFRRTEFDRYATFKCDAAIRGGYEWKELCETLIPVPSINKQKEIVKEYNTIVNRINLNKQLIQKLEETAQAIYKQWFVDFEFPDENGKPYKTNGGEMVFNDELEKEIPKEWEIKKLEELTKQICVAFVGSVYEYYCEEQAGIPMLRTTDITENGISYKDLRYVTNEFHTKNKKSQLKKGDLLVARHGSNGMPVIFDADFEANALNVIIIKPDEEIMSSKLVHCFLTSKSALEHIQSSLGGSVQEVLNTQKISDIKVAFPNDLSVSSKASTIMEKIQKIIENKRNIKIVMENLRDLLLSKLATIEN